MQGQTFVLYFRKSYLFKKNAEVLAIHLKNKRCMITHQVILGAVF
jgi:hypothetical protein